MERERFSLLLLEPNEKYFEDYGCILIAVDNNTQIEKQTGSLKMCSKSLIFVPREISYPILKIHIKECEQFVQNEMATFNNVLSIKCKQYAEMLERNELTPYKFICKNTTFQFHLKFAVMETVLQHLNQLQRASTLSIAEHNGMIAAIVHSRHSRGALDDRHWMNAIGEVKVNDWNCEKVSPLVTNPGKLILTNIKLYFQSFNNADSKLYKIELRDIKKIIKRRFLLQHTGVEILCSDNTIKHLYISFTTPRDRDEFYDQLLKQEQLQLVDVLQREMTIRWQNGLISNYDYLLYINSLGDRTKLDLTQYPVFPWVLTNYTSKEIDLSDETNYRDLKKPVGALNQSRFEKLKARYDEMPEPKFLYGSHYSAPGLVLFYLVRKYPQYMLCLQNGRFDHPDRMFNSVADVFRNCLTNLSDFKELIPEFYDLNEGGSFLMNTRAINFGYRHDGSRVDNVTLPPWADSPANFVKILRDALESEYVSKNLHHWIDLIFGYKQRGEEAIRANNVFYHVCYEGSVDLSQIKDLNDRHALEVQIMEFGQIPKQVFTVPHPYKLTSIPQRLSTGNSFSEDDSPLTDLELIHSFIGHKAIVGDVLLDEQNNTIISVGHDACLKIFSIEEQKQLRSLIIGTMALSSCLQLPDKTMIIGCWDNRILFYDLDCARICTDLKAHEDAVCVLAWANELEILASGSWDCSILIWKSVKDAKTKHPRPASCLVTRIEQDSAITSLAFSPDNKLLASGNEDGELFLWETVTYSKAHELKSHQGSVYGVGFSPDGNKFVSCGQDRVFRVIDMNTTMILYEKQLEEKLLCVTWLNSNMFLGTDCDIIYLWDMIEVKIIKKIQAHKGPIKCITVSSTGDKIVTGGDDRTIKLWKPCL